VEPYSTATVGVGKDEHDAAWRRWGKTRLHNLAHKHGRPTGCRHFTLLHVYGMWNACV